MSMSLLLSKDGALSNIWMAAYYFRKLKKQQIADTDIISSIEKIFPEVQISYRVLAHILLGIVKIFSKKVDYLYHDCNEALTSIIRSFHFKQRTVHKKSTTGLQNAHKKDNGGHQGNAISAEEVDSVSKNGTPTMQLEMMRAPYHDAIITLPNCFELDAFDLEIADEGSADKQIEKFMAEDLLTSEKDQCSNSFLIEYHNSEEDNFAEHNRFCFTPMDDVLPYNMMDVELSEFYNSESIGPRSVIVEGLQYLEEFENHEGHSLPDEQAEENIRLVKSQDRVSSNIQRELLILEQNNDVELMNSCKPSHCEQAHDLAERNSDARILDKSPDKYHIPFDSGLPSPKFAVTTPAKRKEHGLSRKRKILYDDKIVLSNENMKMWIHDASNLVRKRRKAPHKSLDVWKAYQISHLHENFMKPFIPYISLEHKAILHDYSPAYLPQKKCTSLSTDKVNVHYEISTKVRMKESSPPPANFSEIATPDRSEVRIKDSSLIEIPAFGIDMMDDIGCFLKERSEQDSDWTVRTRVVAKYLLERFLYCKDRRREEILNLARVLGGENRTKSARIFYEILTLKTHGCIDVKQDSPYSDIILSPTPQLEAMLTNQ